MADPRRSECMLPRTRVRRVRMSWVPEQQLQRFLLAVFGVQSQVYFQGSSCRGSFWPCFVCRVRFASGDSWN